MFYSLGEFLRRNVSVVLFERLTGELSSRLGVFNGRMQFPIDPYVRSFVYQCQVTSPRDQLVDKNVNNSSCCCVLVLFCHYLELP